MKKINDREAQYPIDDIFLKRHSPRALSGESITKDELMTLFEAARWAPSSYNIQPWRFVYAMRGTPEFDLFLSFLIEFNKAWAINASALIVTISNKTRGDGKENTKHTFDTGSAWENLALQAEFMGLVAHGMGGFDDVMAKEQLAVPNDHKVEMMIAIGKTGKIEDLPEAVQARETMTQRKPLEEIVFEGKFKA